MYEGKKCVVRCDGAGVFFAEIKKWTPETGVATLKDARRLWRWDGASECLQLAAEGTKNPRDCKFTMVVPEVTVARVLEVSPCSAAAAASLEKVPAWKI